MKLNIVVIGSAKGNHSDDLIYKCKQIGQELVAYDCIAMSGGTTGLSYEVIKEVKQKLGFTIGFSPAENPEEHKNIYKFPIYCLISLMSDASTTPVAPTTTPSAPTLPTSFATNS